MADSLASARREAEELIAALAGQYQPPVVRDLVNVVADLLAAIPAEGEAKPDRDSLERMVEIEREGQRAMARALEEIHRLSRLDVAINYAPAPQTTPTTEDHCARCGKPWCCHMGDGHDEPICPRDGNYDDLCREHLRSALAAAVALLRKIAERGTYVRDLGDAGEEVACKSCDCAAPEHDADCPSYIARAFLASLDAEVPRG